MKPIAICENKKIFDHYTAWAPRMIAYCQEKNIPYEIVNCYGNDFISNIDCYSALAWPYQIYVISDRLESRNIITAAELKGLPTFPNSYLGWHFDDKIAEMYAFQSVKAPIPNSWVFYLEDECVDWLKNKAVYPLVAKLRCGSGANNVRMLNNSEEAIKYAGIMFSKGFDPSPSLAYKAYSKIQSSKNIKMIISRAKKIPQFLSTRKHAKMIPHEKGYCYFQEFIENAGYDLKVVVIRDKITFCARNVRKNDFRASGGGNVYYDRSLLTDDIIDTAFKTARDLKLDCVGFDFVINKNTGLGTIIEMCYGFDYETQKELGAYVDENHVWHEEPVCAPDEMIDLLCERIENENCLLR